MNDTLQKLYEVVQGRKAEPQEGSYTCYLFDQGLDKILKKVGEESAETIIAAKNGESGQVVSEMSDLMYHLMVLLVQQDIPLSAVMEELDRRSQKIGNLKKMHVTDRNT
ncbi:MAG TPA: phosphoribosyl-ATP diphosphatase [Candidatus Galloscillospira stercoripullorum]|nr:phosphoribosyl-ATP diphosphatase [Candidatus Galloscillospira stercoripullorum]